MRTRSPLRHPRRCRRGRTRSEIGPHASIGQSALVGDRPCRQPIGVRLRDHERVVTDHDHPVGNHTSSATGRVVPSGSTTATMPGLRSSHGADPGMSTHARPSPSTTIALNAWRSPGTAPASGRSPPRAGSWPAVDRRVANRSTTAHGAVPGNDHRGHDRNDRGPCAPSARGSRASVTLHCAGARGGQVLLTCWL